jgi:hypothetical protein
MSIAEFVPRPSEGDFFGCRAFDVAHFFRRGEAFDFLFWSP